jgi:hypothetical protein
MLPFEHFRAQVIESAGNSRRLFATKSAFAGCCFNDAVTIMTNGTIPNGLLIRLPCTVYP